MIYEDIEVLKAYKQVLERDDSYLNKIYKGTPREVWDEKKCEKVAKHKDRDGYGTLHPYPGFMVADSSQSPQYGYQVYNGGYIAPDGEHYKGYNKPYPKIPDTYGFYRRSTWGVYIAAKEYIEKLLAEKTSGVSRMNVDKDGFEI